MDNSELLDSMPLAEVAAHHEELLTRNILLIDVPKAGQQLKCYDLTTGLPITVKYSGQSYEVDNLVIDAEAQIKSIVSTLPDIQLKKIIRKPFEGSTLYKADCYRVPNISDYEKWTAQISDQLPIRDVKLLGDKSDYSHIDYYNKSRELVESAITEQLPQLRKQVQLPCVYLESKGLQLHRSLDPVTVHDRIPLPTEPPNPFINYTGTTPVSYIASFSCEYTGHKKHIYKWMSRYFSVADRNYTSVNMHSVGETVTSQFAKSKAMPVSYLTKIQRYCLVSCEAGYIFRGRVRNAHSNYIVLEGLDGIHQTPFRQTENMNKLKEELDMPKDLVLVNRNTLMREIK